MGKFALAAVALLAVGAASAADPVTIPDPGGISFSAYATALTDKLGGVLSASIVAGFAIFAVIMGFHYVRKMIKGAG